MILDVFEVIVILSNSCLSRVGRRVGEELAVLGSRRRIFVGLGEHHSGYRLLLYKLLKIALTSNCALHNLTSINITFLEVSTVFEFIAVVEFELSVTET